MVNPAKCETIGKVPISTRDEIDESVKSAQEAFTDWRRTTPVARARYLFRLKGLFEENFKEVSRGQTQDQGFKRGEFLWETNRKQR